MSEIFVLNKLVKELVDICSIAPVRRSPELIDKAYCLAIKIKAINYTSNRELVEMKERCARLQRTRKQRINIRKLYTKTQTGNP